jgi:hypothetical protein
MADTQTYFADVHLRGDSFYLACQNNLRLTKRIIYNFNISPGDFAAPACAEHFKNRLLSREPAAKPLNAILYLISLPLLGRSENPVQKMTAVPLEHLLNAGTINQIYAVKYFFHCLY